ncbi:MAG: multiple sugar transport system permease protein [Candidatus Atribacteria bacterium]|nr:multiple sugar transport system permease protein [Candidatus Atribacteria bacterium]
MRWFLRIIKSLLVALVLFFFLFPVYWLVTTAFKQSEDWFTWPPSFFPSTWTLGNFLGLEGGFFGSVTTSISTITPYLRNSVVVAVSVALISTAIAALAAYAISRYKIGGMGFISWIISIRMLPPIAAALPLYVIFSHLHLVDTWWALIAAHLLFTTPFSTWILITFFNDIPRELDEAAYVDGASPGQAFLKIALPLGMPGLAACATLSFVQSWGEFLMALVLTTSDNAQTLPIYLGRFITGWRIAWGPLAAAGLVTMIPVIVFSLIMQRYLLRGLTFGAVKG